MRKTLFTLSLLIFAVALHAQSLAGLRIDGGNTSILVYLDGKQVNLPATSCFVAGLAPGYYLLEVYATTYGRAGQRVQRGEQLHSERIYVDGRGMRDVVVQGRSGQAVYLPHPDREVYYPGYGFRVMDETLFDSFYKEVRRAGFTEERKVLLQTAAVNSAFTSAQCLRLCKLFSFDDDRMEVMKMLYPHVVDKEAFFTVIGTLSFTSNREEMNRFVRNYKRR